MRERFWELPLAKLASDEWEALCDGCGKCCLNKIEYEDTGELAFTRVACPGRFDGRIERQKVGLVSNTLDQPDDVADLLTGDVESVDLAGRCLSHATGFYDNAVGLLHLA